MMTEIRRCTLCGTEKPLAEFGVYRTRGGQRQTRCNPCRTAIERARTASLSSEDRERRRSNVAAWRAANPEKAKEINAKWLRGNRERARVVVRACRRVRKAIKEGVLTRPTACEACGITEVPIEAAHWNYTLPLAVRWLCRPCHRKWDAERPKTVTIKHDICCNDGEVDDDSDPNEYQPYDVHPSPLDRRTGEGEP